VTPPGPDGGGRRSKDWITYVTDDAGSGDLVIRRHVWGFGVVVDSVRP
jgi:hypothetical protein